MSDHNYEALYAIQMYPVPSMSGYGINVLLFPAMKKAVEESGITQVHVDRWMQRNRDRLLKAHGFNNPELYKHGDPRITWGPWGPEHISVPGNACGVDLDSFCQMHAPPGGVVLSPHNVDSPNQAHFLLAIFCEIVDTLVQNQISKALGMEPLKMKPE